MKKIHLYQAVALGAMVVLSSCEVPSKPNFNLEQRTSIPIIKSYSLEFLGGRGALIDTTDSSFEDLFRLDGDGKVRIVQELDFDIGEFDSALPEIQVDPITIESQIGDIEIDDFNASFGSEIGSLDLSPEGSDPINAEIGTFNAEFSGSGEAGYAQITGNDPALVPAGTNIPAGTSPEVVVALNSGDFVEATIQSGAIRVVFRNELGFNISSLSSTMFSDGTQISTQQVTTNITHNSTQTINFPFNSGDILRVPLQVRLVINWEAQATSAVAGSLIIQEAGDNNLVVRRAVADIPSQVIDPATPNLEINNPNFVFAIMDNSTDPTANRITVSLRNTSNLPLTNSTFNGLPQLTLRNSDGEILDQPRAFTIAGSPGATSIGFNQTGTAVFNLNGAKLTKVLSYSINAGTQGGNAIEVNATDFLEITASTSELKLLTVNSDIDPQSDISLSDTKSVQGDFVNAEVERGTLVISFTNDSQIPLVINELRFFNATAFRAKNTGRFFNEGSEIGRITNFSIPPNSSVNTSIDITGRGISATIGYSGRASSPGTNNAVNISSTDQIRTSITGSVTLKNASAVLDPQSFTSNGTISIDDDEFKLSSPAHFVEIKTGLLNFTSIINEIDLDIDDLVISFPDIRRPGGTYGPADSLVIQFTGNNRIRRRTANQPATLQQNLAGYRLYALNNEIRYNVSARTENTRISVGADTVRTVNNTDLLKASVEIQNLKIASAFGEVAVRTINLNSEPETGDKSLDLFNDAVVQITDVSDLEELSKRISNIKFFNPSLNLQYQTNIGVATEIYAAILGISEQNNEVYLTGRTTPDFLVTSSDTVGGFLSRGVLIPRENLIKFRINGAETMGQTSPLRSISFTSDNSNVDDFLSNLPTSIRFVGKALVNPESGNGFIVDPIDFSTTMGIDVPLNFATNDNPGVSIDTIKTSLKDLPKEGDDNQFKSARMILRYDNGLPLDLQIALTFMDQNYQTITQAPLPGRPNDGPYRIAPSAVDPVTRFATTASSGALIFYLDENQLRQLHRTEYIQVEVTFQSTNGNEVKIRATDKISIGLNAEFSNSIKID